MRKERQNVVKLISLVPVIYILATPSCPNNPNPNPTPTPTVPPPVTTTTTVPPINVECFPPDGNLPGWIPIGQIPPTKETEVSEAKKVVGEQCGQDGYATTDKVAKQLRVQKNCAGRDNDAVLILAKGTLNIWEEWKVVAFNNGCWTGNPYKGSWRFDGTVPPTPVPTPNPTPTPTPIPPTTTLAPVPTPSPIPTPTPITCPVTVSNDYWVDPVISNIGTNPQLFTETTKYCGSPVRNDVFANCGTKCCTLGVDGGNQAAIDCDKVLFGDPKWTGDGSLEILTPYGDNPYNVKVLSGSGNLKVCGSKGPCNSKVIQ